MCALMLLMSFTACGNKGISTNNGGGDTTAGTVEGESVETDAPEAETDAPEAETKPQETEPEAYVYVPDPKNKYTGGVGVGTYSTSVTYKSVKVVNNADRHVLVDTKFENLDGWNFETTGGGSWDSSKTSDWVIDENGVTFADTSATGATIWTGEAEYGNYVLTVKGTANEGAEALRVFFAYQDNDNYYVFNIGGWGNTVACVECMVGGVSTVTDKIPIHINYGEEYTVSVNVGPSVVNGFLDGEQLFSLGAEKPADPFEGAAGFGHWSTEAYVDNIKVVSFTDGSVLYENDFADESKLGELKHDLATYSGGSYNGSDECFEWEDGMLHQTDASSTGIISYFGDPTWRNYIYSVDVMPVAGAEGATILGAIDLNTPSYVLYNCGGWSNTKGCWQTFNAGTTDSYDGDGLEKTLEYDEWHTLQLVVLDYAIFSYIDGEFCQAWWN